MSGKELHIVRLYDSVGCTAMCGEIVLEPVLDATAPSLANCRECLIEQLRSAQATVSSCIIRLAQLEALRDAIHREPAASTLTAEERDELARHLP